MKTALNSSFCAVTADSKSWWQRGEKSELRGLSSSASSLAPDRGPSSTIFFAQVLVWNFQCGLLTVSYRTWRQRRLQQQRPASQWQRGRRSAWKWGLTTLGRGRPMHFRRDRHWYLHNNNNKKTGSALTWRAGECIYDWLLLDVRNSSTTSPAQLTNTVQSTTLRISVNTLYLASHWVDSSISLGRGGVTVQRPTQPTSIPSALCSQLLRPGKNWNTWIARHK